MSENLEKIFGTSGVHAGPTPIPRETGVVDGLDRPVSGTDLDRLFELFLQRPVNDDAYRCARVRSGVSLAQIIGELLASPELAIRFRSYANDILDGAAYRIPTQMSSSGVVPREVVLIGSCAFDALSEHVTTNETETRFEKITFNNASPLPVMTAARAAAIDFQIVQLPLRTIMPEHMYFNDGGSDQSAQAWFEVAKSLVLINLEAATVYHREHGLETYVLNFLTPQQNAMGRLGNPYSLMNPVYFISQLNRFLYDQIEHRPNVFLIDAEQIAGCLGKRYIQDDSVTHLNHGSLLGDVSMAGDEARLEPIGDIRTLYDARVENYNAAIYAEVLAAHRSVHQCGAIKLVIFDLDDTLWRGVAAERLDDLDFTMTEGWPLGILEAAAFLHKRGIMLGIVSKNEDETAQLAWRTLHEHRFPFDNFIARRINWDLKSKNVAEIIALANVQPDAVLFVDDNPVERAQVRDAIPGIRTLDASLSEWRRVLLWSAELQPATISEEALIRAASIRGKVARDADMTAMDHAGFLRGLSLEVTPRIVRSIDDPLFARCLELINKTNQFNTTGRRWSGAEMRHFLLEGGWLLGLSVRDRFAAYGLTAVVLCRVGEIVQYVMSCRIFGMQVERAAAALALPMVSRDAEDVRAETVDTGRNALALDFFAQSGFRSATPGEWSRALEALPAVPDHISVIDA